MANETGKGGDAKSDLKQSIDQVNSSPDYRVVTKTEYNMLLALAGKIPGKPNPMDQSTSTPGPAKADGAKSKLSFNPPGFSPIPRHQPSQNIVNSSAILNATANTPSFPIPKLPFFSGSDQLQKGDTTYEVWNFEVKCLQNAHFLPDHIILQAMRNSLKGEARSMLVSLGENATIDEILERLDGFYGNVSTPETLIQSFYSDFQKENESIVSYGLRLEQILSRAIRSGHIGIAAKDSMLCSKFWTGLRSQQLRNSTRHLYDTIGDFQALLKEIRKVEQEEVSGSRPATKSKAAQQQSGQASASAEPDTSLLKQMTELMGRMKSLEQKLEAQQQTPPSYNTQVPRGGGRGYSRNFHRGTGRGYSNRGNYQNNRGSFGSHYPSNRGGYSRGGNRGGASGRGATRGGNSENLNY